MKLKVKCEKSLDIRKIDAILEIKVNEKRPDIAWYLRNIGRWKMSRGEEKNLEEYYHYLGLMRGGELTKEGEKAKGTEFVMMPEAGLYQIMCTNDVTFGNRIVHMIRRKPLDIIEGNSLDFPEYELYDQIIHKDLVDEKWAMDEYWVRFQKQRGQNPKVVYSGMFEGKVIVEHEEDVSIIRFDVSLGNTKIQHHEEFNDFNVLENMSQWFNNWERHVYAIRITYDEVKDNPAVLANFSVIKKMTGQVITTPNGKDNGDWTIEVSVQVVPKSKKDANLWLVNLLLKDLSKKQRYLSLSQAKSIIMRIVNESPISKKYPEYEFPVKDIFKLINAEDQKQAAMIMAAEDLSFPTSAEVET